MPSTLILTPKLVPSSPVLKPKTAWVTDVILTAGLWLLLYYPPLFNLIRDYLLHPVTLPLKNILFPLTSSEGDLLLAF